MLIVMSPLHEDFYKVRSGISLETIQRESDTSEDKSGEDKAMTSTSNDEKRLIINNQPKRRNIFSLEEKNVGVKNVSDNSLPTDTAAISRSNAHITTSSMDGIVQNQKLNQYGNQNQFPVPTVQVASDSFKDITDPERERLNKITPTVEISNAPNIDSEIFIQTDSGLPESPPQFETIPQHQHQHQYQSTNHISPTSNIIACKIEQDTNTRNNSCSFQNFSKKKISPNSDSDSGPNVTASSPSNNLKPPIPSTLYTFSQDSYTGRILTKLSKQFLHVPSESTDNTRSGSAFAGFLCLLLVTFANYMLSPMRDAAALAVGVTHIPVLTLVSTILALVSSVPVGWLFEAPNPERTGRRWRNKVGLTRGETQGTSLALFYRCFAICLVGYSIVFKLVDIYKDRDAVDINIQNRNYVTRIIAILLRKSGKLFYIAFFLVVHLMKLHSLSLIWGVASEAMEYEEHAEERERIRCQRYQEEKKYDTQPVGTVFRRENGLSNQEANHNTVHGSRAKGSRYANFLFLYVYFRLLILLTSSFIHLLIFLTLYILLPTYQQGPTQAISVCWFWWDSRWNSWKVCQNLLHL